MVTSNAPGQMHFVTYTLQHERNVFVLVAILFLQ
jgi:hypothetical protein